MTYPLTTDPTRMAEAVEILRDLRSRAMSHWETLNNWLITDALDEAITLLQDHDQQDHEPDIDEMARVA